MAKSSETWQTLLTNSDIQQVAPFRSLRPGFDAVFQYIAGGKEYLATHSESPYGVMTDQAFTTPQTFNLLRAVRRGSDYTEFEVPSELLSVSALTRGNGSNVQMLTQVYRQIGTMISEGVERTEGQLPLLRIADVGYDRVSRQPVILPPAEFGPSGGGNTLAEYDASLTDSVLDMVGGTADGQAMANVILGEVRVGMNTDAAQQ